MVNRGDSACVRACVCVALISLVSGSVNEPGPLTSLIQLLHATYDVFTRCFYPETVVIPNWTLHSDVVLTYSPSQKYWLGPGYNSLFNMYCLKGGPLPDANYNKLFSFSNSDKSDPKIPPVVAKRCLLISKGFPCIPDTTP
jgi:hypothetical protein